MQTHPAICQSFSSGPAPLGQGHNHGGPPFDGLMPRTANRHFECWLCKQIYDLVRARGIPTCAKSVERSAAIEHFITNPCLPILSWTAGARKEPEIEPIGTSDVVAFCQDLGLTSLEPRLTPGCGEKRPLHVDHSVPGFGSTSTALQDSPREQPHVPLCSLRLQSWRPVDISIVMSSQASSMTASIPQRSPYRTTALPE